MAFAVTVIQVAIIVGAAILFNNLAGQQTTVAGIAVAIAFTALWRANEVAVRAKHGRRAHGDGDG